MLLAPPIEDHVLVGLVYAVIANDGQVLDGCGWSVGEEGPAAWVGAGIGASLEDGMVRGFDIRVAVSNPSSETKPTFTLHGHDKAVCKVSYNPAAPNLLATGSTDKMVKLWDLTNNQPSCVASRSPKLIWDTLLDAAVSQRFGKYRK
ncbi:hypothetical protein CDL15_Pgr024623 [Punica granatum]|uniref:Uncharacterized protein n=1 Tax=Punica granatum TaxID=22663 RepID=A0A218W7H1_PUNGR|nr:hypothetical protein CDL15_Pgr024623 [Punica granatum]